MPTEEERLERVRKGMPRYRVEDFKDQEEEILADGWRSLKEYVIYLNNVGETDWMPPSYP